jgi:hypothetical protein
VLLFPEAAYPADTFAASENRAGLYLETNGISDLITATFASWIVQLIAEEDMAVSEATTAAQIDELRAEVRHLADELRRHDTGLGGR